MTDHKDRKWRRMRVNWDGLEEVGDRGGLWYETPEEIEAGLKWGKRKAELIRWVRRQMDRRLTAVERRYFELHYFRGLSFREVAAATGSSPAAAHRAVRRSLRKLRVAAKRVRFDEGKTKARRPR